VVARAEAKRRRRATRTVPGDPGFPAVAASRLRGPGRQCEQDEEDEHREE
jgi:hypothetical protein